MARFFTLRRVAALVLVLAVGVYLDAKVLPRWFPQYFGGVWGALGAPDSANVPAALRDLPVVHIQAKHESGPVAILLSGNGGWWGIDDGIAEGLARAGVSTIGLNSLAYFIRQRSPQEVAAVIERMAASVGPDRPIILVGFSFGADVVATAYAHLSEELKARIPLVSLLGLSRQADYAIGFMKIAGGRYSTLPALAAIDGPHLQCISGADEGKRSGCESVDPRQVEVITLPGGHHLDGDYDTVARLILKGLGMQHHGNAIRYAEADRFAWLAEPERLRAMAGAGRND